MSVKGNCEEFCPEFETKLRIREKLLHYFECKNGQINVPGILVKCFSRSAAGTKAQKSKDLRTEKCLQRTVNYLLTNIILDTRKSYCFVYDFIFDRLRAIRQEIVIQNFDAYQSIKLLEPMIMFLSFSRYRLCEEEMGKGNFDAKICEQHLQECLKKALRCYDDMPCSRMTTTQIRNRAFVEALYQIFNLNSVEALTRTLTLPQQIRDDKWFSAAFKISLSYFQGNLYQVLRGLQQLPHILCAIGSLKLQELRRKLLKIFSIAYRSSQVGVPVDFILSLTAYANKKELFETCNHYNIQISDDRNFLFFHKNSFKQEAPVINCKYENYVEMKLERLYLPDILLMQTL